MLENDYKKVVQLVYKEENLMRAAWKANKANKAKSLHDCFETRLCLADCLLN